MENVTHSNLIGDLINALAANVTTATPNTQYSCCPIQAFSYERNTVLGRFFGDIGLGGLKEFSAALHGMLTERVQKIILDFSSATLSRTAIGVLVSFSAAAYGLDKRLYIYSPSQQVEKTMEELEIKGFYSFLRSEDDVIATTVV